MKKGLLILGFTLLAFSQEKKYKFELNEGELNKLWYIIDNSNAPHNSVKEIQALIQAQLKSQVDTSKVKK